MGVNPYAPPIADGVATETEVPGGAFVLPRGNVIVARAWLGLVVLGLVLGGGAALVMGFELWDAERTLAAETYNEVFTLHATASVLLVLAPALFACIGSLLVPEAMRSAPSRSVWLAGLACLMWLAGAAVLVERTVSSANDPVLFILGAAPTAWIAPAFLGISLALTALHFGVLAWQGFRRAKPLALLVVLGMVVPLLLQIVEIGERAAHVTAMGPPGIMALRAFVGESFTGALHLSEIAAAAIAVWVLARRPVKSPAALLALVGIIPAVVIDLVARRWLATNDVDLHLHDTWFETGVTHIEIAAVLFAWIAGMLAWAEPLLGRSPRAWLARVGALCLPIGIFGYAAAAMLLGARGMPRRYFVYDIQHEPLHRTAQCFAMVALLGIIAIAIAFVLRRRESLAR